MKLVPLPNKVFLYLKSSIFSLHENQGKSNDFISKRICINIQINIALLSESGSIAIVFIPFEAAENKFQY